LQALKSSRSKLKKKIKRNIIETVTKLVAVLYLLKRRILMGCNCGKSNKSQGNIIITDSATRLMICKMCPQVNKVKALGYICGKLAQPTDKTCGCILKLKTKLKGQRCPQGKW
tara:strand:+ start:36 stop:374 length:339 start_codon:yes stop_codon:yes gene_type:complete